MKTRVFKPIGAGAAAGLVTAGLFGQRHAAARLALVMILLSATSLGAPEALRRCIGRLTARRQVRANGWMAALLTLVGAGLLWLAAPWLAENIQLFEHVFPVYSWTLTELRWWIAAAAALALTRCMTVTFDAAGDGLSVLLTELLSGLAVGGSLLMFRNTSHAPMACGIASLGLMAVVGMVGLSIRQRDGAAHPPMRALCLLRDVPAALVRELVYPAAFAAGFYLADHVSGNILLAAVMPQGMSIPLLMGMLAMELMRSAHRRDARESAPLAALVTLAAAMLAFCLAGYIWLLPETATPVDLHVMDRWVALKLAMQMLLAASCGLGLYVAKSWRTAAMVVLTALAALMPVGWLVMAGLSTRTVRLAVTATAGMSVLAATLAATDWAMLHRQWRAARIRRRAHRTSRA